MARNLISDKKEGEKMDKYSEILKKSVGEDVENGPRLYVTYASYGYSEEVTKKLREEADRFWENVKEIIENSAGKNPAE